MSGFQDSFAAALLDPNRPAPEGLVDPGGRQAGRRFDVYRNNVAVSLSEALETAFPVIRKLLGNANFRILARAYVAKHPPRSPLMMFYGEDMPAFLGSFAPAARFGYLPDVARLELALRRAYHAADATPLDPSLLESIPPDRLMASRLRLAPAVQVLRSRWPVHAIWRYNAQAGAPKPAPQAEDVLIHRAGYDPAADPLGPGGARFVTALREGAALGAAVDAAAAETPDFDLATALGQLLAAGAITGLEETP